MNHGNCTNNKILTRLPLGPSEEFSIPIAEKYY